MLNFSLLLVVLYVFWEFLRIICKFWKFVVLGGGLDFCFCWVNECKRSDWDVGEFVCCFDI